MGSIILAWKTAIKGALSPHEARCAFDSMKGRALSDEAVLRALWDSVPDAVLTAKVKVCGPDTYYPAVSSRTANVGNGASL